MTGTACDLCGSAAADVVLHARDRRHGTPGVFRVVRCRTCGLARTDPAPADPVAAYPEDYYSFGPPAPPTALELARAGSPRADAPALVRVAARLLGPLDAVPPTRPGRILDVGCGSGTGLLLLEALGWECEGVELGAAAVCAAHAGGLSGVRRGDLLELRLDEGRYDTVRFWHSLEHMRSPTSQLVRARRLLRPGGVLLVGVPNFGSPLSRLGDRWHSLDVPRHLWHFDAETLAALVARAGFAGVDVRARPSAVSLAGTLAAATRMREVGPRARRLAGPVARLLAAAGVADTLVCLAVAT